MTVELLQILNHSNRSSGRKNPPTSPLSHYDTKGTIQLRRRHLLGGRGSAVRGQKFDDG